MASVIKLVQGDDLPGVTVVIRDANKAAAGQELDKKDPETWAEVDLTGCTVRATVSASGANTKVDDIAVFPDGGGALVLSLVDCTFMDVVGEYDCEIAIWFPGAGQQTVYDFIKFSVRERINVSSVQ